MGTTATVSTTFHPTGRTWTGLGIALFVLPLVRQVFRLINPSPGTALLTARELLMFASATGLLLFGQALGKLPFTSLGLGTSAWWKSILWAFRQPSLVEASR